MDLKQCNHLDDRKLTIFYHGERCLQYMNVLWAQDLLFSDQTQD